MVKEAQVWLNATYSWNPYYISCDEDGFVGQGTMKSFVCALQIALGVSYPDGDFGPGTLGLVENYGPIGPGHDNPEMCNFVRHGLWCKGYSGGSDPDVFSDAMVSSVYQLTEDMGLSPTPIVEPKTLKALFSTDPYILTSGGKSSIQNFQRWMNGRYVDLIDSYFISPCDGHFTRDSQQALLKAVQYETGTPVDEIDGMFGPNTASRIRANELSEGDSGNLVSLFTAACIANEDFILDGESWTAGFRSTFTADTVSYVEAFQEFAALPNVNGEGDFDTWAQLLVSMGNANRSTTGSDCVATITAARVPLLKNAGIVSIGRYLDESVDESSEWYLGKAIDDGELATIFDNGLRCFPISQYNGRSTGNFTFDSGYAECINAHDNARTYGFPKGTCIYFAVDYDATDTQIDSAIIPYFRGVKAAMKSRGNRYVIGVYGTRNVCSRISGLGYARWSFVAGMSWGYSGNLGYPLPQNWSFNQIREQDNFFGSGNLLGIDYNVHRPGTDFGVNRFDSGPSQSGALATFVQQLESLADEWADSPDSPSDTRDTFFRNKLVLQYLKFPTYDGFAWDQIVGTSYDKWLAFADDAVGDDRVLTITDPASGVELQIDHLAATAYGTLLYGSSTAEAQRGDLTGWLGDLSTFYAEWRKESDAYASGYEYCEAKLADPSIISSFGFNDFVEDVDGYWIARSARSTKLSTLVTDLYTGGQYADRYSGFLTSRFGGAKSGVVDLAETMLTNAGAVPAMRDALILSHAKGLITLPAALPGDTLAGFIDGFADMVVRAANEL